jgi:signal peptidase I
MQNTLFTGDRLIVNRLPVTWAHILGKDYVPKRGQIIVFKNPLFQPGDPDEYIVKRVIAFGGESVQVKNGHITVFNKQNPNGFDPDVDNNKEPLSPTSGDVGKETVPDDSLFVSGDNRIGDNSLDSRSGLGYIPYYDIIGPVGLRIYPFNRIRSFGNEGSHDSSTDPVASAAAAKELLAH